MDVTGNASLSGEIDIDLLNSIAFQAGEVFDILNAGSLELSASFDLPTLGGGLRSFPVVVNGDELDLDVVSSSAPEP